MKKSGKKKMEWVKLRNRVIIKTPAVKENKYTKKY